MTVPDGTSSPAVVPPVSSPREEPPRFRIFMRRRRVPGYRRRVYWYDERNEPYGVDWVRVIGWLLAVVLVVLLVLLIPGCGIVARLRASPAAPAAPADLHATPTGPTTVYLWWSELSPNS